MKMRMLTVMAVAVLLGSSVSAQQPQPQPVPQPAPPPAKPPAPSIDQPNVRFDITLSDEGGGIMPVSKSVVLMVQGSGTGSLRSGGVGYLTNVPSQINNRGERIVVDLFADVTLARYELKTPDKIRARVAVDYQPFSPEWKGAPGRVRAQVDVMLDNGKETTLWQTTDPVMGVRTTINVTATVLK